MIKHAQSRIKSSNEKEWIKKRDIPKVSFSTSFVPLVDNELSLKLSRLFDYYFQNNEEFFPLINDILNILQESAFEIPFEILPSSFFDFYIFFLFDYDCPGYPLIFRLLYLINIHFNNVNNYFVSEPQISALLSFIQHFLKLNNLEVVKSSIIFLLDLTIKPICFIHYFSTISSIVDTLQDSHIIKIFLNNIEKIVIWIVKTCNLDTSIITGFNSVLEYLTSFIQSRFFSILRIPFFSILQHFSFFLDEDMQKNCISFLDSNNIFQMLLETLNEGTSSENVCTKVVAIKCFYSLIPQDNSKSVFLQSFVNPLFSLFPSLLSSNDKDILLYSWKIIALLTQTLKGFGSLFLRHFFSEFEKMVSIDENISYSVRLEAMNAFITILNQISYEENQDFKNSIHRILFEGIESNIIKETESIKMFLDQ